jgi:FHA domain
MLALDPTWVPGSVAITGTGNTLWSEALITLSEYARVIITAGSERAPALMLGLAVLLMVPIAAVLGNMIHKVRRRSQRHPRQVDGTDPCSWPAAGWIWDEETPGQRVAIDAPLVRIGRQDDNDICLRHHSVARYHAVIRKTSDCEFVVTDVSGRTGSGVQINGTRLAETRLADGDIIEIGVKRLRFECTPL